MSGPAWLAGGFAALMIAVAALCAGRLVLSSLQGKDTERGADGLHVVMGVAMAGMLEPRLIPVPGFACAAVFAAAAAWFTWRGVRPSGRAGGMCRAHPAAHAVECAVMVYMLLPVGSWPSGRGHGMAMPGMNQGATVGNPALTLLLASFMLGYVVWAVDRLASSSRAPAVAAASGAAVGWPSVRPALAPRLAACCKIVMGITMGYMLVMMLLRAPRIQRRTTIRITARNGRPGRQRSGWRRRAAGSAWATWRATDPGTYCLATLALRQSFCWRPGRWLTAPARTTFDGSLADPPCGC